MWYRLPPPPDGRIQIDETATESLICVDNGTVSYISIPCFYADGRIITRLDVMRIDHFGWPHPGHPDRSFQPRPRCRGYQEVDLEAEGYTDAEMVIDLYPDDDTHFIDGISAECSIDGGIVRVAITAMCADARKEDLMLPYSIYINGVTDGNMPLRSVVTKGMLHVLANPFTTVGPPQ